MSSVSEVGHAKNEAHFVNLITYCTSYGATYNPSNSAIKLNALNSLSSNAQTAIGYVTSAMAVNSVAINNRLIAFHNIKKLATRMLSALAASGATKQQKANATTINRKIQGSRAKITPVPTPSGGTTTTTTPPSSTHKKGATLPGVNPPHPTPAPGTISVS